MKKTQASRLEVGGRPAFTFLPLKLFELLIILVTKRIPQTH